MKLKVIRRHHDEIETDIDLPVYFHYQDEMCYDTYVKITDRLKITIKREHFQHTIEVTTSFFVDEFEIQNKNNLTTEEDFKEFYNEFLESLNKVI
jgi:hypothetical protein